MKRAQEKEKYELNIVLAYEDYLIRISDTSESLKKESTWFLY